MHFLKARAEHIGHIAHWWWAVIYGGWTLLCSFDVLVEHIGSESFKTAYNNIWIVPKWGWQAWIIGLLIITVFAVIEGSYQHTQKLESRLVPKLNIPKIVHEQPLAHGAMTHYIDVLNESDTTTVTEVKVKLMAMEPPPKVAKWLPIPLHIKHDNKQIADREFNMNPRETVQIDLVSAPGGAEGFWIVDVVTGNATGGWTSIKWEDVPSGVCVLTVIATGKDVPPTKGKFDVYKDMAGYLRCVPSKQS